jgi:hypothetical protein
MEAASYRLQVLESLQSLGMALGGDDEDVPPVVHRAVASETASATAD